MNSKLRSLGRRVVRPSAGTVIGAVALAVPLTGVAYATIPGADGAIPGCYVNKTGVLRVSDTGCRNGETLLTWNQKGPVGPEGPEGPEGPQGPEGPAGTSTSHDVLFASGSGEIKGTSPESGAFTLTKTLPAGSYVLNAELSAESGNFDLDGSPGYFAYKCSLPTNGGRFERRFLLSLINNSLDPNTTPKRRSGSGTITTALTTTGGPVSLICGSGGEGIGVEATLLATKVDSVG